MFNVKWLAGLNKKELVEAQAQISSLIGEDEAEASVPTVVPKADVEPQDEKFAALEAEISRLQNEIKTAEQGKLESAACQWTDKLVAESKILPAQKQELVGAYQAIAASCGNVVPGGEGGNSVLEIFTSAVENNAPHGWTTEAVPGGSVVVENPKTTLSHDNSGGQEYQAMSEADVKEMVSMIGFATKQS